MKHYYIISFIFISFFATAQKKYEPEQIIWNGTTYPYRYHHMEQYFRYYPNKRPVSSKDTTIINRNYLAVFEVLENKFYLKDLLINGKNQKVKNYSVLHKLNENNEPLFLNWINGLFDIGVGLKKFSKTDSITPVYDNYIVFEIKKGIIGRTGNVYLQSNEAF